MTRRLIFALLSLLTVIVPAAAQDWPAKPVRVIVPFGPGAGADIGARLFAEKLSQKWGQAVVVENRPGGDSIVAIQAFLSANDDHVLLFGPAGNFTVHPFNYSKLSYNPADLIPIARASNTILALAVKQDAPYKNMKDFAAAWKANNGLAVAGGSAGGMPGTQTPAAASSAPRAPSTASGAPSATTRPRRARCSRR